MLFGCFILLMDENNLVQQAMWYSIEKLLYLEYFSGALFYQL